MMIYGEDFFFKEINEARYNYEKLEMMRDYLEDTKMIKKFKIIIATPSEYFEAIKKTNKKYSVYNGDFFPY